MTRRKAGPTPESIKKQIESLDWGGQQRLWLLLISDPESVIGGNFRSFVAAHFTTVEHLEKLAGIDDIDALGVLTDETEKKAAKRLKKTVGAVKQARHRARKERHKSMLPGVGVPVGQVTKRP